MVSRRTFIKTTSLLSVGSLFMPLHARGLKQPDIGLILYTVRGDLNNDLKGTLKKVAETGYTWLEAASYRDGKFYGSDPKEFRTMIEDMGMKMISTHTGGINSENVKEAAEAAVNAGMKYLVMPSLPGEYRKSGDHIKTIVENFNKWGKICNSIGVKFGYHNHAFEFEKVDDLIPYDYMLKSTDPELVTFQLDLYWIIKAGYDPLDYFTRYPGRFELWHVKDMDQSEGQYFTEVGQGVIDFVKLFQNRDLAGMKYFFVEQDNCRNHSPLERV